MIYAFDILTAAFAMATGFATSWIGYELVRIAGWRQPAQEGISDRPVRIGMDLALAAVIGPRLLLSNGFANWRRGLVSLPLYSVLSLIAAGWSMCSGVLVLQLAFASGYFLT